MIYRVIILEILERNRDNIEIRKTAFRNNDDDDTQFDWSLFTTSYNAMRAGLRSCNRLPKVVVVIKHSGTSGYDTILTVRTLPKSPKMYPSGDPLSLHGLEVDERLRVVRKEMDGGPYILGSPCR